MKRLHTVHLLLSALVSLAQSAEKPNVLFVAIDDLRPELGCYGKPVHSPHIDGLAESGTLFERAYVQVALCMPSRVSVMTGQRPDTTGVVDFSVRFRDVQPDVVTMPQHLRANGYTAVAFGKIFHNDDKVSWSEPLWRSHRAEDDYHTEFGRKVLEWTKEDHRRLTYVWDLGDGVTKTKRPGGLPWEAPEIPDNAVRDGQIADAVVAKLEKLRAKGDPFFLAVGFHKPHLPFIAPKRFFDLYDPEEIEPAPNSDPPEGAPKYATYNWNDLRHYYGIPDVGPVSPQTARELKHAYYACVSFVDAQVGKVLAAIDPEKTIVVLWGDHGWQLGEHGMWDKHSNYETSTRIPLIVRLPGQQPGRSDALVEAVDLYPTLSELCGLELPGHVEGTSFAPLIEDPDQPWKSAVFSQYRRVVPGYGQTARGMGYSMRTDRYRFVEWMVPGTEFREYELYDHEKDPGENVNLANREEHAGLVASLKKQLKAGWRKALPPGVDPPPDTEIEGKNPPIRIPRLTLNLKGWTVRIDRSLTEGGDKEKVAMGRKALDLLEADLTRISLLMPAKQLAALRKVVIVVDEHPELKGAQYHPDEDWLTGKGYEASLAKCVHVSRASTYVNRDHIFVQPSMIIHELSHAYHDQVLGWEYEPIRKAFAKAQLEGQYKEVLFVKGGTRKHYALSNHKEYFAEATEAWFGTNDFYPFVRSELEAHDPRLYEVLEKIWGEAK